ncbi:hypothetical protein PAAG_03288 [Paracoccidioides lutzii Pb01]|uniref:Uncharacterized protein n=1 Tax=Paracoccidioides lutzii (strain ATCC MYA-826 / Pb01) TaxID=502779 RepID=C1GY05_PARBA|nr:hypothetical protein PAAG_03288 [Paracoccidioides lutzii Pb01]EEH41725.2 hypothetical protein PAAG_03288 [Paracoccidioides lutzii Pb01]
MNNDDDDDDDDDDDECPTRLQRSWRYEQEGRIPNIRLLEVTCIVFRGRKCTGYALKSIEFINCEKRLSVTSFQFSGATIISTNSQSPTRNPVVCGMTIDAFKQKIIRHPTPIRIQRGIECLAGGNVNALHLVLRSDRLSECDKSEVWTPVLRIMHVDAWHRA